MIELFESRYASSPNEVKKMGTSELRDHFLIPRLFTADAVHLNLSNFDRFICGGIMPVHETLILPNPPDLKAAYFLERRELGIINIGGSGEVVADDLSYGLNNKEALYIARGTKKLLFISKDAELPAKFYLNSAPAHHRYENRKVSQTEVEMVETGSRENANHRVINKYIVNGLLSTCQLQMGMTELKTGSVWNTMPAHTHERRMEVYFYFDLPEGQSVCHFMGETEETRHIWVQNEQAVISPNWSIHSGAGTSNYSFIWGMAGENLDYSDMDIAPINSLK
jgi:4-deoxy-L-threo-5-hexosulose-uronate ketol-isomerase